MDHMHDAILRLADAIEKQNALQERANALMGALIEATAANSQEMLELRTAAKGEVPVTVAPIPAEEHRRVPPLDDQ